MEYAPFTSVCVPLVDPFTEIVTPGRPEPSSAEVTFPVTFLSCANRLAAARKVNRKVMSKFFFMYC